jgi:hypothetical protein
MSNQGRSARGHLCVPYRAPGWRASIPGAGVVTGPSKRPRASGNTNEPERREDTNDPERRRRSKRTEALREIQTNPSAAKAQTNLVLRICGMEVGRPPRARGGRAGSEIGTNQGVVQAQTNPSAAASERTRPQRNSERTRAWWNPYKPERSENQTNPGDPCFLMS